MERSQVEWTRAENKVFESGLAIYGEKTTNRWAKVAAMIPGKTVWDVMRHYKDLEHDVSNIEAGRVDTSFHYKNDTTIRKKGLPWTKDEHRRFLLGLMKYGKGDWRNISRNFVPAKTPTQVASHAQKYFLRQIGANNKRRPSIHDFTTTNLFLNLNHNQPTPPIISDHFNIFDHQPR